MRLLDWLKSSHADTPRIQRWVVLDVETSGLDPQEAQLLAVAAVAVQVDWQTKRLVLLPGESVEIDIRPSDIVSDKSNILIHGIGQQRQQQGVPLREALPPLLRFIGESPLLAFHAWFDKAMLARHFALAGLEKLPNPWIDIEKLCIALHPKSSAESLDDWLAMFDIPCTARHEAAADTYAECELLQRIWPALAKDAKNWKGLKAIEAYGRGLRDT
jgi:DNA polymerase III subunit epsilon